MPETTITVNHKTGLHMRPAGLFVQTAARYKSSITVKNLDRPTKAAANAKTLINIIQLGVAQGHRIHIDADGEDADEAIAALESLVAANFGLDEPA